MKTVSRMSILLVFIIMNACTEKVETKAEMVKDVTVFAIHELDLMPDVNGKDFEAFVLKEVAPIYNKMKGQKLNLVKGDRGVRTGKYAIILTFESVADRDGIYPPSGGFVGDFGEDALWEKFYSMATGLDGTVFTDYIKVN